MNKEVKIVLNVTNTEIAYILHDMGYAVICEDGKVARIEKDQSK